MQRTCRLELKIEFNDFTVSLRGGWLYTNQDTNRDWLDLAYEEIQHGLNGMIHS